MEDMKLRFREAMKLMWPGGVDDPLMFRDVIRIFSMGWAEAMMKTDNCEEISSYVTNFRAIAQQDWMPDDSWKWW